MSEAPKKIWLDAWTEHPYWSEKKQPYPCVKYIRADIVEEMREALISLRLYLGEEEWRSHFDNAQAALKRLEEE